MDEIYKYGSLLQRARVGADLSQADIAAACGTSQSAIARLEQGAVNPTVSTLVRSAAAAGYAVQIALVPLAPRDPIIERYKLDVDRTLLRANLQRSVAERLRSLGHWQMSLDQLQRGTRAARKAPR
jgi:transcriptional regulator with XRE-family HTH domain